MKKRLISFLLLFAMIVTAMPVISFAEGEENTEIVSTMTEAEYNALYVQDGLKTAFDVMVLNNYWGESATAKATFPTVTPMDDPAFGSMAQITVGVMDGDNETVTTVTVPYYTKRYDSAARNADGVLYTSNAFYIMQGTRVKGTAGGYTESTLYPTAETAQSYATLADAKADIATLEAADTANQYVYWVVRDINGSMAEEYHIMTGTKGDGELGFSSFTAHSTIIAGNNTYHSLEAAYDALPANTDENEYWIVGDDISAAFAQAMTTYSEQVNTWLAEYNWGSAGSALRMGYNVTTYNKRLRDSFMEYSAVKEPTAGKGYLTIRYPYNGDESLKFNLAAPTEGTAHTMELVAQVNDKAYSSFYMFANLRPQLQENGTEITSVSNLTSATYETTGELDRDAIDTLRLTVAVKSCVDPKASTLVYNTSVLFEQGSNGNILYKGTGTYSRNSNNMIGYGNYMKGSEIYALRAYTRELSESEKAQNHFADVAKWYKLDVSEFYENRREFGAKTLERFYKAFANIRIGDTAPEARANAQAAAEAAYDAMIALPDTYPELTENYYNGLYVQDGLMYSADFFKLNKHWSPDGYNYDPVLPIEPSKNSAYSYTAKASDAFKDESGNSGNSVYDLSTSDNRFVYNVIDSETSEVKHTYFRKADAEAKVAELNQAAGSAKYSYVIPNRSGNDYGQLNPAWSSAVSEWHVADKNFFKQFEVFTLSAGYELANSRDPDYANVSTSNRHSLTVSAVHMSANGRVTYGAGGTNYGVGLRVHNLTSYTVDSVKKYPVTFEMVANFAKPATGQLTNQTYLIFNDLGATLYFVDDNTFMFGDAGRSLKVDTATGDAITTNKALPYDRVLTLTYTINNAGNPDKENQYNFSIHSGADAVVEATCSGTIGYGVQHIGRAGMPNSDLYAIRYYSDELTALERAQNHFADLAKFFRLDLKYFDLFDDGQKARVYAALADYDVTDARDLVQSEYDRIANKIANEVCNAAIADLLVFDGYQAKLMVMPGLRSTYSINVKAVKTLETYGKTVIVGAMMALATTERNAHESLELPEIYGQDGFFAEGAYNKILNGIAYQEIYHTGEQNGDREGVVAKLLSEAEGTSDSLYRFAFTTTYSEANQTADMFRRALLYRGYFIVTDESGAGQIYYVNADAPTFDRDGDDITIYALCKHIENNVGNAEVDIDGKYQDYLATEPIQKVLEVAFKVPENYYDLYVPGALYNINFASANSGMVVKGANPNAKYADAKYGAAADIYDDFIIDSKEGVVSPLKGGTATISEGGWKFQTPYRYSYWFNDDTKTLNHTDGSRSSWNFFVTSPDLTQVNTITKNGEEIEGQYEQVNYYNNVATVAETQTIGGVTNSSYLLEHTAPDWATGFYISPGVWGKPYYSSSFGDGYFNFGDGNVINYNDTTAKNTLAAEKQYTVELAVSLPETHLSSAKLFMGVPYVIRNNNGTVKIESQSLSGSYIYTDKVSGVYKTNAGPTNYQVVTFEKVAAHDVNSYSFTVDVTDIANKNVKIGFYGNGTSFGTQVLESPISTFSNTWQYAITNTGTLTYAFRVYDWVLTADEALQNHFADVAIFNRLDIRAFNKLDDEEKLFVYKAFEGVEIDSEEDLQAMLDAAVATAKKQAVTISLVEDAKVDYYYSDGSVDLADLVENDADLEMTFARTGGTGSGTITGSVLDFEINGTHIIEVTTAETETYKAGSFTFEIEVTLDPGLEDDNDGVVDTTEGIDLPIDRN